MNFNTDNFKVWQKPNAKKNENTNYVAFQDKDNNRAVIFDSADAMIECFNTNIKEFGGNGTWEAKEHIVQKNPKEKDPWRFGNDFPTLEKTNEALSKGTTAEKYLDRVEETKAELFEKFPELGELDRMAFVKRRRRRFNEDDGELDIDRYMCSDPACFVDMPRQDVKKKSANIYLDIAVNAGVSADSITKNVIAMLAIVEIIEKAGINTEIIVSATGSKSTNCTNLYSVACVAKRSDEPLDTARLLSFCLPAMFRQYVFGCWTNINEGRGYDYGLGQPQRNLNHKFFDLFNSDVKVLAQNSLSENLQLMVGGLKTLFNIGIEEATF